MFGIICQKSFSQTFAGFSDPGYVALCNDQSEEVLTIRAQIGACMAFVQPLFANSHFILHAKLPKLPTVHVYNSLNGALSNHFLLQLFTLYGQMNQTLEVEVPPVQLQRAESNQCGPLVCSSMADVLTGKKTRRRDLRQGEAAEEMNGKIYNQGGVDCLP